MKGKPTYLFIFCILIRQNIIFLERHNEAMKWGSDSGSPSFFWKMGFISNFIEPWEQESDVIFEKEKLENKIYYRNMENDKCNDSIGFKTSKMDNNVIMELVTDADCNDSHGKNNVKYFRTLNIDSELRNNI